MMAREYGGDLKDSEDTEYRRLNRLGAMFDNYITEGDGIRRAAQNRTSVRSIMIANAHKQTAQVNAITLEFLGNAHDALRCKKNYQVARSARSYSWIGGQ